MQWSIEYTQYCVNLEYSVQWSIHDEWGTVTHKGLSCLLRSLIKQSHHWTIIMTLIINDIIIITKNIIMITKNIIIITNDTDHAHHIVPI